MSKPDTRCMGRWITGDGKRQYCSNPGVPVFIIGEFGRRPERLCNSCIERERKRGWKVQYQLSQEISDAASNFGS